MKTSLALSGVLSAILLLSAPLHAQENRYACKFEKDIPFGVSAWSQSERVRKGIGKEVRFGPYKKGTAADLANDALVIRGGEASEKSDPRETAFWQAYDDKGWYIYIEAKEPQIADLLNRLPDPRSPGRAEAYELFFSPGERDVPYYQIFINPYVGETQYFDWGIPSADYRSLKTETKVESLPLADGVGTFVFIPWSLIYERAPIEGGDWRFNLIRWMPFSKAGGVTWGGRVHETGKFGKLNFQKPSQEQKLAIERRLLKTAWFKFQATANTLREYVSWDDAEVGDPEFYKKVLAPEIERLTAMGNSWGEPEQWTAEQVKQGMAHLKDFMEFDYKVSSLREHYLKQKLFSQE